MNKMVIFCLCFLLLTQPAFCQTETPPKPPVIMTVGTSVNLMEFGKTLDQIMHVFDEHKIKLKIMISMGRKRRQDHRKDKCTCYIGCGCGSSRSSPCPHEAIYPLCPSCFSAEITGYYPSENRVIKALFTQNHTTSIILEDEIKCYNPDHNTFSITISNTITEQESPTICNALNKTITIFTQNNIPTSFSCEPGSLKPTAIFQDIAQKINNNTP